VLVLGVSYKENIADTRESPSYRLIDELRDYGVDLLAHDPYVSRGDAPADVTVVESLDRVQDIDAIVVAVGHDEYRSMSVKDLHRLSRNGAVLVDIRRLYDRVSAEREGFLYRTL
jgi:UDP-N-acetyl-D-mannosaminuronate dehydrogenase